MLRRKGFRSEATVRIRCGYGEETVGAVRVAQGTMSGDRALFREAATAEAAGPITVLLPSRSLARASLPQGSP